MGAGIPTIIGFAVLLPVPVYPVAQTRALIRWRGWSFLLALLPLPVTGFALYTLIAGLREGPNLAPIFVVLLAPISTPWLWIIGLLRR